MARGQVESGCISGLVSRIPLRNKVFCEDIVGLTRGYYPRAFKRIGNFNNGCKK